MSASSEKPAAGSSSASQSFFRQSGWLMFANISGGFLMWAVHFLSKVIGPDEYGKFGVLLSLVMCIPTIPVQMALAQQTAAALATGRERQLAGLIRLAWLSTFLLWLVSAAVIFFLQEQILIRWGMSQSAGLWITWLVVLLSLWLPIFWGVLQGQQNFLWFGWSMMLNAVGRLTIAVVVVTILVKIGRPFFYSAGVMAGVLAGMLLAGGVAAWQCRALWRGPSLPFNWLDILREVGPSMLGFAAFQFLFTGDTMFVGAYFSGNDAGFYVSAGTLSRALMWLVGPLAAVMFPKIVQSAARAEKNDLVNIVLAGTAVLAVAGAISLSILGPFIVRIISGGQYVKVAASLLPWYASAMIPLALANVMLNNLLARSSFKVVLPLIVQAIAYGIALAHFHDSLIMVLKTVALSNTILLLICVWFTWSDKQKKRIQAAPASARAT